MLALLLTLALHAVPSVDEAESLAKKAAWDDLYGSFGACKPGECNAEQRARFAGVWAKACEANLTSDAAMAFTFAERAVQFGGDASAVRCYVSSAIALDQPDVATNGLIDGLRRFPQDGQLLFLFAKLSAKHDAERARILLEKLPPDWARKPEVEALRKQLASRAPVQTEEERKIAAALADARAFDRTQSLSGPSIPEFNPTTSNRATPLELRRVRDAIERPEAQATLVYVWASWCGYCKKAFPVINGWAKQLGGQGMKVVGMSVDEEERSAQTYLAGVKDQIYFANYHLTDYESSAFTARLKEKGLFYQGGLPFLGVLDHRGKVVTQTSGWSEEQIRKALETALSR